ncbi:MAG: hypothetical protein WBP81_02110 [Solirubrobacteraceae bacterium]
MRIVATLPLGLLLDLVELGVDIIFGRARPGENISSLIGTALLDEPPR